MFQDYIFEKYNLKQIYFYKANLSRKKFLEFAAAAGAGSSEDLDKVIKKHRHFLESIDSDWFFEHAALRMLCGATAEARAAGQIMQILPDHDRQVEMLHAIGRLEILKVSEANKMSPVSVQAGLNYVTQVLQSLNMGISLEVRQQEVSKLTRDCIALFQHFLRRPAEAGKPPKQGKADKTAAVEGVAEITGEKAYRQILEQAASAIGSAKPVPAQDFADLVTFRYLATADMTQKTTDVIAQLQTSAGPDSKKLKTGAASSSSTGASDSAGSAAAPKKAKEVAQQSALAMFS